MRLMRQSNSGALDLLHGRLPAEDLSQTQDGALRQKATPRPSSRNGSRKRYGSAAQYGHTAVTSSMLAAWYGWRAFDVGLILRWQLMRGGYSPAFSRDGP